MACVIVKLKSTFVLLNILIFIIMVSLYIYNFRVYRYIAYRRLARWIWHRLSKKDRRPLPSCAVAAICQRFSSDSYIGTRYNKRLVKSTMNYAHHLEIKSSSASVDSFLGLMRNTQLIDY